jgi:argininosuccinate synthase
MNSGWTGDDVRGFTRIFGNQTAIYRQVNANTTIESLQQKSDPDDN